MSRRTIARTKKPATDALVVRPSRIVRLFGVLAALLVAASVGADLLRFTDPFAGRAGIVSLVTLDGERNLPTFFSVFLLLVVAQLMMLWAALARIDGAGYRGGWLLLSSGFMAMAADEGWQFHERLIDPVRAALGWHSWGAFHFTWVIPGIIFVLAGALAFTPFLLALPRSWRRRLLVAGAVYFGGALGCELLGGWLMEGWGSAHPFYLAAATLEETLELWGAILFVRALLLMLADRSADVRIEFRAGGDPGRAARAAGKLAATFPC